MITFLQGDALDQLRTLEADSVQCVVTSPPYWGASDAAPSGSNSTRSISPLPGGGCPSPPDCYENQTLSALRLRRAEGIGGASLRPLSRVVRREETEARGRAASARKFRRRETGLRNLAEGAGD